MHGLVYRATDEKVGHGANTWLLIVRTYASWNCCGCTTTLDASEDVDRYFILLDGDKRLDGREGKGEYL